MRREEVAGAVFAALADENRRHLVQQLSRRGACTATQLAAELPVTRQAVSKHLYALEAAGLVVGSREGREVRYRLEPTPLHEAMAWTAAVGARWDERLAALSRHAGTLSRRRPRG